MLNPDDNTPDTPERLPDALTRKMVDHALTEAGKQLNEKGEALAMFLICYEGGVDVVAAVFKTEQDKDMTAFGIRELVKINQAHTVLFVCEIWTLPDNTPVERVKELRAKYRQVADMPERVEVVRVAVETRDGGVWDVIAPIRRAGKKITLGAPRWRDLSEFEFGGRMVGWFAPIKGIPKKAQP